MARHHPERPHAPGEPDPAGRQRRTRRARCPRAARPPGGRRGAATTVRGSVSASPRATAAVVPRPSPAATRPSALPTRATHAWLPTHRHRDTGVARTASAREAVSSLRRRRAICTAAPAAPSGTEQEDRAEERIAQAGSAALDDDVLHGLVVRHEVLDAGDEEPRGTGHEQQPGGPPEDDAALQTRTASPIGLRSVGAACAGPRPGGIRPASEVAAVGELDRGRDEARARPRGRARAATTPRRRRGEPSAPIRSGSPTTSLRRWRPRRLGPRRQRPARRRRAPMRPAGSP